MHRREHSGLAWHDDPAGGERDADEGRRWPTVRDHARPEDDGPWVPRSPEREPAPRWWPGPEDGGQRPRSDNDDRSRGRGDDDSSERRLEQLPPPVARDDRRPPARTGDAPPAETGVHVQDGRGAVDPPETGTGPHVDDGQGALGAPAPDDPPVPRHHEVEERVPAVVQLRAAAERAAVRVRRSVPLRTTLFVLPPVLLPLALGLSLGPSLVVTLLLLWLAAATGLLATLMFDGSDQLALRAIDRRLQALEASRGTALAASPSQEGPGPAPAAGDTEDALLAIGTQLDRLNDRLDELTPDTARGRPHRTDDHRPAEQWSGQPHPGQDVGDAPDRGTRQWGEQGWQGRMR